MSNAGSADKPLLRKLLDTVEKAGLSNEPAVPQDR
jgi:hypothetical protein